METGQHVIYITERCVFKLTKDGLVISEIAPGVDLERDVFPHMGFRPLVAPDVKEMDARLFLEPEIGLKEYMMKK